MVAIFHHYYILWVLSHWFGIKAFGESKAIVKLLFYDFWWFFYPLWFNIFKWLWIRSYTVNFFLAISHANEPYTGVVIFFSFENEERLSNWVSLGKNKFSIERHWLSACLLYFSIQLNVEIFCFNYWFNVLTIIRLLKITRQRSFGAKIRLMQMAKTVRLLWWWWWFCKVEVFCWALLPKKRSCRHRRLLCFFFCVFSFLFCIVHVGYLGLIIWNYSVIQKVKYFFLEHTYHNYNLQFVLLTSILKRFCKFFFNWKF